MKWWTAPPLLAKSSGPDPGLRLFRHCLRKQLTWHHELERRARTAASPSRPQEHQEAEARSQDLDPKAPGQPPVPFPALVVISPGQPETGLEAYGCKAVAPGLYHAVPGLVMRVVVAAELPRTRETLLLRLLGTGDVLRAALADLTALPADAWEKSIVTPLLVHFRFGIHEPPTNEEDEMSAEIRAWFEEYQQKVRSEARDEGERRLLLRQLRARFGELPAGVVARVEAAGVDEIELWGERLLVAQSLGEVLGESS